MITKFVLYYADFKLLSHSLSYFINKGLLLLMTNHSGVINDLGNDRLVGREIER